MAQVNTESASVPGTNLILKWSPKRPLVPEERQKLVSAVRLATALLKTVNRQLSAVRDVRSPYSATDVRAKILQHHFALETPGGSAAKPQSWVNDLAQIASGFQAILTGLTGPLVISDAYIKQVEANLLPAQIMVLKAEIVATQTRMQTGSTPMSKAQLAQLNEIEELVRTGPHGLAQQMARNVGGFVKNRQKPALAPDVHAPPLLPQDKGAIHMNFEAFLNDPKQRTLSIARTLIHEASHKFIDTYDFAYTDDPGYANLSKAQKMRNADSYAFAAVSCYKGHLFENKQQMVDYRGDLDC